MCPMIGAATIGPVQSVGRGTTRQNTRDAIATTTTMMMMVMKMASESAMMLLAYIAVLYAFSLMD